MIKEALQYIQGLKEAAPYREKIHGVEWADSELKIVRKPIAPTVKLETLKGFIDFVKKTQPVEGFSQSDAYIVVEDFDRVHLYAKPEDDGTRRAIASAVANRAAGGIVGQPMGIEGFIVALKGRALQSETVDVLIESVSHISLENIATLKDNGVFQEVAVKSGINVSVWKTPPFFRLSLRRTFQEVCEIQSEFFLRLKQSGDNGVSITLHESTFDAWREEVVLNIKKQLEHALIGWVVL